MLGKRGERQRELVFEEPKAPDTRGRRLLREIDALIAWSVVRTRAAGFFSRTGRPSIDPVVMVKMMLIGYLFGVPSDRQLVEECADRLSFREFLGYGLGDRLPCHASFTHWRQRLGSEFFRSLLHELVEQCVEHGIEVSEVRTVDGTSVKAQADEDGPIVEVPAGVDPDAFVAAFFAGQWKPALPEGNAGSKEEPAAPAAEPAALGEEPVASAEEPAALGEEPAAPAAEPAALGEEPVASEQAPAASGEAAGTPKKPKPAKTTPINLHDPDARLQRKRGEVAAFRYHASFCADAATGLVMDATAAALESAETAVEHVRRDPFRVTELVADALYDDGESLAALQWLGVRTYVPERKRNGTGLLDAKAFEYDARANEYVCPEGKRLRWYRYREDKRLHYYIAHASDCAACPRKAECTRATRRTVTRTLHAAGLEECVRSGAGYRLLMRCRRINEHLNRMGKRDHALEHARGLGLEAMRIQAALTAMAIDLKKLVHESWAGCLGRALICPAERLEGCLRALPARLCGLTAALSALWRPRCDAQGPDNPHGPPSAPTTSSPATQRVRRPYNAPLPA